MPMIDADGCLLNVSVEGRDGGPTLMLSNSLGCTLQMWEPQMATLSNCSAIVRYDRRGHGKSGVPPGPYSMERFGRACCDSGRPTSRKRTGADYPWAAWSDNGSARTRRIVSTASFSPTPIALSRTDQLECPHQGSEARRPRRGRRHLISGWLTADFREREPQIAAKLKAILSASPRKATSPAARR